MSAAAIRVDWRSRLRACVHSAGVSRALAVLLALACLLALAPARATDVPYLTGRVVDDANLLSPATRASLDERLAALESRTSDQVVVLTVPSTGGEAIETYANDVFQAWKLGQKGKDNGVLVVVVPGEHKMRIEVGYGLEGTLTDVQASRILRNVMTPAFKANDFNGGISAGVDAVIAVVEGKPLPEAPPGATAASGSSGGHGTPGKLSFTLGEDVELPPWPVRILLGAFIFGIIGLFTVVGVVTPGAGWFLYLFLIPFWAMFPVMVVGPRGALVLLGTYVVAFPITKLWLSRQPWYAKARDDLRHHGSATIGGFTMSSGGGGSSWSSGSSSGGFSGGGGSSGGGGASGSW
jgi:uncharacterized protein